LPVPPDIGSPNPKVFEQAPLQVGATFPPYGVVPACGKPGIDVPPELAEEVAFTPTLGRLLVAERFQPLAPLLAVSVQRLLVDAEHRIWLARTLLISQLIFLDHQHNPAITSAWIPVQEDAPMKRAECGVRETAARLRCSLKHTYTLLYEGKLPGARKQRGRWWVPLAAVEERLKQREARNGAAGD
jgi:Helix-turn-helix domain